MKRKPPAPLSEMARRRARREGHAALEALRKPAPPPPKARSPRRRAAATIPKPHLLAGLLGSALPKGRRVTSPTWLAVIRCMPCAICGGDPHWPFMAALSTLRAQSETNHAPGRGRSGGGSDLETHPACHSCHERITSHEINEAEQEIAVKRAMLQILQALRLGWLLPEFLIQVAAEIAAR